jgi:hypothetical protein
MVSLRNIAMRNDANQNQNRPEQAKKKSIFRSVAVVTVLVVAAVGLSVASVMTAGAVPAIVSGILATSALGCVSFAWSPVAEFGKKHYNNIRNYFKGNNAEDSSPTTTTPSRRVEASKGMVSVDSGRSSSMSSVTSASLDTPTSSEPLSRSVSREFSTASSQKLSRALTTKVLAGTTNASETLAAAGTGLQNFVVESPLKIAQALKDAAAPAVDAANGETQAKQLKQVKGKADSQTKAPGRVSPDELPPEGIVAVRVAALKKGLKSAEVAAVEVGDVRASFSPAAARASSGRSGPSI